jgi:hypothetical protein
MMAKNKAIKNDERKENKLGNRITFLLVLVVLVSIPFIVEYRDEKLTNYKLVKGVVVKHSMMIDVGYPEIVCRFTINGEERLINYSTNDLKVSIGDCVEIRYSIDDPKVSEINYEKGKVQCDN